jgi:hypothetical protein
VAGQANLALNATYEKSLHALFFMIENQVTMHA